MLEVQKQTEETVITSPIMNRLKEGLEAEQRSLTRRNLRCLPAP
jgi:hypothetical protein